MRKNILWICLLLSFKAFSQADKMQPSISSKKINPKKTSDEPTKVFYSQRLINANTVEVLPNGVLQFRVVHTFGDIGGSNGGIKKFFGLDEAPDVKVAFQVGLGNKLNILGSRTRGHSAVSQLWELGLKYQFLRQMENDPQHPFSITMFANVVTSANKASTLANEENSFKNYGDRLSEVAQLMIARKFGKISLQLNPTVFHRTYTIVGGDNTIFVLGGGIRLPITSKFSFISDYFHPFFSKNNIQAYRNQGLELHDAFGVGFEILTSGHIFHLNFTNSEEILENKFIPRTITSWGNGQFRWSFILERNFTLFRSKKNK